jgi:hypothetical protein
MAVAFDFVDRSRTDNGIEKGSGGLMGREICLEGLLIPKDWYHNGRVKSVVLATDDEKEIHIRNPLQQHIIHHLRQRVALWGTFEDADDQTAFQVNRLQFGRLSPE